jgi:hypothetical protein
MRPLLLAAVAAGFVGACAVSVAIPQQAPRASSGGSATARERPASSAVSLRALAPLPSLRRERPPAPAPTPRRRAVAAAPQTAPIIAASRPVAPPPAQEPVTTPSAPAPQPAAPPKEPAPEFDSSEEVFDSSG